MRKRKLGFTLVEIMIVVAIIALLTAIAIPAFLRYRDDARQSLCINNMRNIEHAKEAYAISKGIAQSVDIAWSNIAPYLNFGVDSDPLSCPEGEITYGTGTGASANMGNVTNRITCPNVTNFPGHVYVPGK